MTSEHHREYYGSLSDASLREALAQGPGGYADPAAWAVVVEEAARRSVRVRTGIEPLAPEAPVPPRPADASRRASPHSILIHPDGREVAVKDGFCWPAFFLPTLWAAVQGLWLAVTGLLLIAALLTALAEVAEAFAPAFLGGVAVRLWIGRIGNSLHRRRLQRQGYILVGLVWADGPDEGLAAWDVAPGHPPLIVN